MSTPTNGENRPVDNCPLCGHPKRQHIDDTAHQELNTMGCASCISCEHNRLSVIVNSEAEGRPFTQGDRVFVTDPGLAELRAIFKRFEGYEKPNHHGTVEEVDDDRILIIFDDGGGAPYPPAEVRHLTEGATDG